MITQTDWFCFFQGAWQVSIILIPEAKALAEALPTFWPDYFNATSGSPGLQRSHLWFIQRPAVKSLSCNTTLTAASSFWNPLTPRKERSVSLAGLRPLSLSPITCRPPCAVAGLRNSPCAHCCLPFMFPEPILVGSSWLEGLDPGDGTGTACRPVKSQLKCYSLQESRLLPSLPPPFRFIPLGRISFSTCILVKFLSPISVIWEASFFGMQASSLFLE